MISAFSLGWRTLARRPRRFLLFAAGVTVASATLLDMLMLSEGLERSLTGMLEATGYQVRVTPKGRLPFDSDAVIPDGALLASRVRADPRVEEAVPVWGRTVYVSGDERAGSETPVAAFGLGTPAGHIPTLRLRRGRAHRSPDEAVASPALARSLNLEVGDSVIVGVRPDPAIGAVREGRKLVVTGIAEFVFAPANSLDLALDLRGLAALAGFDNRPTALILVRVAREADPHRVARDLRARTPAADVYAIPEIIDAAGGRMSYFEQLSFVLGAVSLAVAVLLVGTLLTLSVNERWGEIATLRAVGVTRGRMLAQIAWQGLLISATGAVAGLGAGWIIARYLDTILTDFPGLPAGVSFFVLAASDALVAVVMIVGAGLLAGLLPAWRAASVNIAGALREEMA